jgi:putative addiction module killer protein
MEVITTDVFTKWLDQLADAMAKQRIEARIRRLGQGAFGDVKHVGDGVFEIRIHCGPGYRVYYTQVGEQIVILLCGGKKSTQRFDIAKAQDMAKELNNA